MHNGLTPSSMTSRIEGLEQVQILRFRDHRLTVTQQRASRLGRQPVL